MNRDEAFALYRQMLLIRRFEERCAQLYVEGKIGGFLHLYIGQEAVGVGAISLLRRDDYIITSYRDHGYALARGSDRVEGEYNLGRLLAARGAHEEAAVHLARAVALRPNLAAAWFHLGEVRAAQGRREEARDCYERALAVDPTFERAAAALRTLTPR